MHRFISVEYSQPEFVQLAYMSGHEIATHTVSHVGLPNMTQIVGARQWLNEVRACRRIVQGSGGAEYHAWLQNEIKACTAVCIEACIAPACRPMP